MHREFSLRAILLHARLHQRVLFTLMASVLLLSLLLGWGLASRAGSAPVNEAYAAELKQYDIEREMLEQSVRYNRDLIDGINDYFANSLLSKYDLMSEAVYQIQAQVIAPAAEAEAIGQYYAAFAKDKALAEALAIVAALPEGESASPELLEVYFDQGSQSLFINATHPNEDKRGPMARLVLQYIKTKAQENFIEGQLLVTEVGLIYAPLSPLRLKINELVLQRDEAKTQLDQRQKALDSLVAPVPVQAASEGGLLKYLVLGILLSIATALIYLVYKSHAKDARVLISDLKEHYDLPVLFALKDKRNRMESDQALFLEEAEAKAYVESMLALFTEERILVVGKKTLLEAVSSTKLAFVEKLDQEQAAILKQADAVLLSLHPYDMHHSELEQRLSLIRLSGKKILGVIVN